MRAESEGYTLIDEARSRGANERSDDSMVGRVAEALGMSIAELRGDAASHRAASPATLAEIHALLDAFLTLKSPDERRRCISLATDLARGV